MGLGEVRRCVVGETSCDIPRQGIGPGLPALARVLELRPQSISYQESTRRTAPMSMGFLQC